MAIMVRRSPWARGFPVVLGAASGEHEALAHAECESLLAGGPEYPQPSASCARCAPVRDHDVQHERKRFAAEVDPEFLVELERRRQGRE
jgi:hypothetical protein